MKGKQLAMTDALEEVDRFQLERERRETDGIKARLDEKYQRMDYMKVSKQEYPAGSVVIIAQNLFRNNHYTWHFYRTTLNYYRGEAVFIQANNEEWPDIPPWAMTVNHENEPRDVHWSSEHTHWITDETVEPVETWWMKQYREWLEGVK